MLWQAMPGLICGRAALDASATPIAPLDGLSPTTAYSFSRALLTSYGGALYAATGGAIDTLNDQSGNTRNLTGSATARPTATTAGPNSRACADFDGSNDVLNGSTAISSLISNSAGFFIMSMVVDTVSLNNATITLNNGLFSDSGTFVGFILKNVSGTTPTVFAYNWDGNADTPSSAISLATAYVVTWRHEGGNLYLSVNGGADVSVASGNTSTMTGAIRFGSLGGATLFDGKVFEFASFSTIPNSGQRTALIQDFGLHVGASV